MHVVCNYPFFRKKQILAQDMLIELITRVLSYEPLHPD